jgi:hypothetical protein
MGDRVYVGVDPGFALGIGIPPQNGVAIEAWETDDPLVVMGRIDAFTQYGQTVFVVIEDYNTAGPTTKEAKACFKQVGFFQYHCAFMSIPYAIVQPGARIRSVPAAELLLRDAHLPEGRNAVAALAHALSHREKVEVTQRGQRG